MVPGLETFLQLAESDARAQWERIAQREPRPRQERFLPVEVLLCYALFYVVDPHRYGGANIHTLPANVQLLAGLLKRSPGSLTNKMLNLDGSRPHGGRLEPALFAFLGAYPEEFIRLHRVVLMGADLAGVPLRELDPLAGARDFALNGQDEIGTAELGQALTEAEENRLALRGIGLPEQATERVIEQRVRLGQHRFARDVLQNYGFRCGFCDFTPRSLQGYGLLRASHVKPWSKSKGSERLQVANGIAACPTHDAAFDQGLLSVADDLTILRSPLLEQSVLRDVGVARQLGREAITERLFVPEEGRPPKSSFLAFHRELHRTKLVLS